jgi:hypothetical protein
MPGYTTPDNLPYPNDYDDPADSPSVIEDLATASQTALSGRSLTTHRHDGQYAIVTVATNAPTNPNVGDIWVTP